MSIAVLWLASAMRTSASEPTIDPSSTAAGAQPAAAAVVPAEPMSTAEFARQQYLKLAKSRGYKMQKRDGQIVYCRSEAPVGSRFERTFCYTEDVLLYRLKQEEENKAESSRPRPSIGTKPG
jgi:hypothetical protein